MKPTEQETKYQFERLVFTLNHCNRIFCKQDLSQNTKRTE